MKGVFNDLSALFQYHFSGTSMVIQEYFKVFQACFNPTSHGISDSVAATGGGLEDPARVGF